MASVDVKPKVSFPLQPTQNTQTGMYPTESVLSSGQLSSDVASLFLDMTPAVTLSVTAASMHMVGANTGRPKPIILVRKYRLPSEGQYQTTIEKIISLT